MTKNATTIKSYRVTLKGESKRQAKHRVRARRAQDALVMVAGAIYPASYRQEGALKKGRTLLWVVEPSRGDARAVIVEVVRLVPKKPMSAPVRDPRPARAPVPMTVGAMFARLAAEGSASNDLQAQLAAARAENAALKGQKAPKPAPAKPAAPKADAREALVAELAKARAENAALKGEPAPEPPAPKTVAHKADPAREALLAELAKARAENAALKGGPAPKPAPKVDPAREALLAELAKARAENAALKGEPAPKPAAPKPALKAAKKPAKPRSVDLLAQIHAALQAA